MKQSERGFLCCVDSGADTTSGQIPGCVQGGMWAGPQDWPGPFTVPGGGQGNTCGRGSVQTYTVNGTDTFIFISPTCTCKSYTLNT